MFKIRAIHQIKVVVSKMNKTIMSGEGFKYLQKSQVQDIEKVHLSFKIKDFHSSY